MLLTDIEIRREIEYGLFKLEPFDDTLVQPASIDLRLDNTFLTFNDGAVECIDPARSQPGLVGLEVRDDNTSFIIEPGAFVLAAVFEKITMPLDLAGRVEGKSSLGRIGLMVHSTAGFIDPGFRGHITLELTNANSTPIALWPGMLIAQLCLTRTTGAVGKPYGKPSIGSHYQDQMRGPKSSKSHVGFRRGLDKVNVTSNIDRDEVQPPHPLWHMYDASGRIPAQHDAFENEGA